MVTESSRRRAPAMGPEQRREMIVRAALPLVIEHGSAVTTRQVAQAAGIGEGTIFRVFADKDELLDACVSEALSPDSAVAELAAVSLEQPLTARLTEAVSALHAHVDRIGALVGALHATGGRSRGDRPGGAGGAPDRAAGSARVREALSELFEPERASLRLAPEQAALIFLGLLFVGVGRPSSPQAAQEKAGEPHVDIPDLVHVFLHGVLSRPGEP
ncbi:TetR/AcrR family transcriptional regulator [Streptomyces sp. NPDC055189]